MSRRRSARTPATAVTVALVLGAAALLGPASPTAGAAPTPVHELQALSVSPAVAAPSGFATVDITVTATIRADDEITRCAAEPTAFGGGIGVWLEHVGPETFGVTSKTVNLSLVAGTAAAGTWRGTWKVASPWSGTWRTTRVIGCVGPASMPDQPSFDVVPASVGLERTVAINGSAAPVMTRTLTPRVATYGANQLIRLTFRNARGTPLAGRRIAVGTDTSCGFYSWGGWTATLDASGSYAFNRSAANRVDRCVNLTTPQGLVDENVTGAVMLFDRPGNVWWFRSVSATVSLTTVLLGRSSAVNGAVSPVRWGGSHGPRAVLQRYQNRQWRYAGSAPVRSSGRYTLYATPPTRGPWVYRVLAMPGPYDGDLVPTPCRSFTVRAL